MPRAATWRSDWAVGVWVRWLQAYATLRCATRVFYFQGGGSTARADQRAGQAWYHAWSPACGWHGVGHTYMAARSASGTFTSAGATLCHCGCLEKDRCTVLVLYWLLVSAGPATCEVSLCEGRECQKCAASRNCPAACPPAAVPSLGHMQNVPGRPAQAAAVALVASAGLLVLVAAAVPVLLLLTAAQ